MPRTTTKKKQVITTESNETSPVILQNISDSDTAISSIVIESEDLKTTRSLANMESTDIKPSVIDSPAKVKKTSSKKKLGEVQNINTEKSFSIDDYKEIPNPPPADELTHITISGAREHNLKNVSLVIPRDKLVVITGLSGSGKSSLAFDTLYAEGQRRYVECLSPYARQFLGMMKKPDVDTIEGISPAISIEQKSVGSNPRSTVGTVTEVYDYLRLLYSKIGIQYCVNCDIPVQSQTTEQIITSLYELPSASRLQVLAPMIRGRKGHYRELFEQLRKQGYTKVRVNAEIQEIEQGMQLDRYRTHNIELVIDRVMLDEEVRPRLLQSIELALNVGEGKVIVLHQKIGESTWQERMFSTAYSCPSCGTSYDQLAPNMFSYNSPYGACDTCQGLGELRDFDLKRILPDELLSLADGAITLLGKQRDTWLWEQVKSVCKMLNLSLTEPVLSLDKQALNKLMYGSSDVESISMDLGFAGMTNASMKQKFTGIIPSFRHQHQSTSSPKIRKWLEEFMGEVACPSCDGGKLKKSNLYVRILGKSIADMTNMDIPDALEYFRDMKTKLNKRDQTISNLILKEIISRLTFLENVGLGYLSLKRSARSLSGGESQRIRLASQIGSQLVGVMYVLDEPSIGLHQHDNSKLIGSLKELRDLGNTIVVVEHDREMIEEADFLVDIGPGAGVHGGTVIIADDIQNINQAEPDKYSSSVTMKYLSSRREIDLPDKYRQGNGKFVSLVGANGNNLQDVTLNIPLGTLTCITGMSGSGKSTLINSTLYPILNRHFFNGETVPLPYKSIEGLEHIDKVIEIDQSPIGRTPRSNPATYTGLFTLIRDHFTLLPDSKVRGYKAGRFSFNVPGGRCEECEGAGIKKIEMNFLPDVYVKCDVCDGKRYNSETCAVKYKGKSIADVLDMTVEEALGFFSEIPKIKGKLQTLFDVGLTYITLGQQAPTLSGGEAQRVKLATELSKTSTGKTLYLLDEPTTGLHFEDINILLSLLHRLADKGNTVVVIEHNLDVVKCADWIIDLGPTGGKGGGRIIAEGTPETVSMVEESITGRYLAQEIQRTLKAMELIKSSSN